MQADQRREKLIRILSGNPRPVSGSRLADTLRVSRQVIVQDIALLRAGGEDIFATPQGYIYTKNLKSRPKRVFAVQHSPDRIEEELRTIIEYGGKVLDVIVEHQVYGELNGLLMLANADDLQEFMAKIGEPGVEPLSSLTRGVHLHTVEADNEANLAQIGEELKRRGFSLDEV